MSIATRAQHRADQWEQRVGSGDWGAITAEVNEHGGALLPRLLTDPETDTIGSLYEDDTNFRATVSMSRHRFGSGEYRYFEVSCPEPVERLKQALHPQLLPIARDWHAKLGRPAPWPDTLDEWLRMCHNAEQNKPRGADAAGSTIRLIQATEPPERGTHDAVRELGPCREYSRRPAPRF